jgi:hypothetical protein
MATESVAPVFQTASLFHFNWTMSERPEELTAGLYAATSLLELVYAGAVALEERSGRLTEPIDRALLGDLILVVGLAAQSLARQAGVLPSQQAGA